MPWNQTTPTWLALNAANDTSASYNVDLRTGLALQGGNLVQGNYFDLTNEEANNLSYKTNGILYAGRYRRVQVDSGATAANVKTGTIGLMPSLAVVGLNPLGTKNPPINIVTSYDQAIGNSTSIHPVVFLNTVTPGNYCFVQELGIASVLGKASLQNATPALGDLINSAATGLVDDPTTQTASGVYIGRAIDLPKAGGLFRVILDLAVWQG
jgi:hypothetical protein